MMVIKTLSDNLSSFNAWSTLMVVVKPYSYSDLDGALDGALDGYENSAGEGDEDGFALRMVGGDADEDENG